MQWMKYTILLKDTLSSYLRKICQTFGYHLFCLYLFHKKTERVLRRPEHTAGTRCVTDTGRGTGEMGLAHGAFPFGR